METMLLVNILIIVAILALIIWIISMLGRFRPESPERKAGRLGERFATGVIGEILTDEDILLTNVEISSDGRQTELDNVIINKNGVFIIETKNYNGVLSGDEDTYEWLQTKTTYAGNVYQKTVKNPIRQVKRQIYILSQFLKHYDINVWINGYVFFVERNSPIESSYVLSTRRDIDHAIHRSSRRRLSPEVIDRIEVLLG